MLKLRKIILVCFKLPLHTYNNRMMSVSSNTVSTIFPGIATYRSVGEKSLYEKLLMAGIISSQSTGIFTILPLGLRSINKLNTIIENQMNNIGAQRLLLPHLVSSSTWKKSKRYESAGSEIMKIKDRHNVEYILSPTYEEAITEMVASFSMKQKLFPLRLYQISTKFRDEPNPRNGMFRGREFLMKDLYTFDRSEHEALTTYKEVSHAYKEIFQTLFLPFHVAEASVGDIGGSMSHEYHVFSKTGEDTILLCEKCNFCINSELALNKNNQNCSKCGNLMKEKKGIEVGHTFHLGTKYSSTFLAKLMNENSKDILLDMGCYGIGVSRLLMTTLEFHARGDNLLWPPCIAPYKICMIAAKGKSHESQISSNWCQYFYDTINKIPGFCNEVLVDDRNKFTIGKRLNDMKKLGIPLILIFGKSCTNDIPKFELIDNFKNVTYEFNHLELLNFFKSYKF